MLAPPFQRHYWRRYHRSHIFYKHTYISRNFFPTSHLHIRIYPILYGSTYTQVHTIPLTLVHSILFVTVQKLTLGASAQCPWRHYIRSPWRQYIRPLAQVQTPPLWCHYIPPLPSATLASVLFKDCRRQFAGGGGKFAVNFDKMFYKICKVYCYLAKRSRKLSKEIELLLLFVLWLKNLCFIRQFLFELPTKVPTNLVINKLPWKRKNKKIESYFYDNYHSEYFYWTA